MSGTKNKGSSRVRPSVPYICTVCSTMLKVLSNRLLLLTCKTVSSRIDGRENYCKNIFKTIKPRYKS